MLAISSLHTLCTCSSVKLIVCTHSVYQAFQRLNSILVSRYDPKHNNDLLRHIVNRIT